MEERKRALDNRQAELDKAWEKHVAELERISGLTQQQAKDLLLKEVEAEARNDTARVIREIEAKAIEEGDRRSREIITMAIQRVAADQVAETTVSTVELPSDEMKGRIIGRGGRNIRTIENITGVDLVIDDTPEAVILSCFDPVRREVARIALNRLILDGRIHPARIEKIVEKAQEEVDAAIREEGERAAVDLGVHGLHPEIVRLLGRLHYRTSYGQNVLQHSVETAQLCAMMAAELGADVGLAKKAGLLHDIGKAVDHEVDGPHALIGAEIAKRYGLPDPVVNAIGAHHAEMDQLTVEAVLVQSADAISGARPGARRESLENYIKRIKALEQVANSFEGVETSFAIQAGREIRIIVKPDEIDDLGAIRLSRDVAKKVEESLQYPGQIKVTVIRETRATEYAK
jgi:ribonuclease Y